MREIRPGIIATRYKRKKKLGYKKESFCVVSEEICGCDLQIYEK